MKNIAVLLCVAFSFLLHAEPEFDARQTVASPDGRLQVSFSTDAKGMRWSLSHDGKTLVKPSRMGFRFASGNHYDKDAVEFAEMKVIDIKRSSSDNVWETKLYRRGKVRDRYNELVVELEEVEARAVRVGLGKTVVEKASQWFLA